MILFIVISNNPSIVQQLGKMKGDIIPRDLLKKGYFRDKRIDLHLNAIHASEVSSSEAFEKYVLSRSQSVEFVIALLPEGLEKLAKNVRSAIIVDTYSEQSFADNLRNGIHQRVGRLIRLSNYIGSTFSDANDRTILSLPLRNFSSSDLLQISRTIHRTPLPPDVALSMEIGLKVLRSQVRRRKSSSYSTKYVVDAKSRFFVFGKEAHSRPESGKPHGHHCVLNSMFRFGIRIDNTRHFNVSEGEGDKTHVSGQFYDCHGNSVDLAQDPARTHLNMFSNDFF